MCPGSSVRQPSALKPPKAPLSGLGRTLAAIAYNGTAVVCGRSKDLRTARWGVCVTLTVWRTSPNQKRNALSS
jgi:hypothetical protein